MPDSWSAAYATTGADENCEGQNKWGNCEVTDPGDGDDSGSPPKPNEPSEGATWTEENWSTNCSQIDGIDLVPCHDRDPCLEGEEYSHFAITLRDWVFRGGTWVVERDWYDASPFIQCRKVSEQEITEEDVRRAVEKFGMKLGDVQTAPPGGRTLVNFDTIVWTEQSAYEFDLEVLETPIQLRATPAAYHWSFGDGHTATFDTPGFAYSRGRSMDDYHTHVYTEIGHFEVTLTIDYEVQWNSGTGWQPITGTISSDPSSFGLDVVESRNQLNDGK